MMDIVRQSLAITLVFVLLWAALWLLKKKDVLRNRIARGSLESRLMESRGKLALSPHHSLHCVRVGEREVVLALHPGGVTVVCDLSASAPAALPSRTT